METATKVAIVTGSNKGIGYAIVRGLCKQFNGHVYVTARNEALGKAAVAELEKEGVKPYFHQLDITDEASVERLATYIKQKYGGLDLLVNNAGIAFKQDATEPFSVQAEVTLRTNYWGTLTVCNYLFPLLRSHARVVHVSSFVSQLTIKKCSEDLQKKLRSIDNLDELGQQLNEFVKLTKENKHNEHGWPSTAYGVSKVGVSLMTPIQQATIDNDKSRTDIIINACCPGYVSTDMTSHKGNLTIDEGADTPIYVSLIPANATEPRGKFLRERRVEPV